LNPYKHLLSFDLSSYGAALAMINHFVDGDACRELELSPCGISAQLILLFKDEMALKIVSENAISYFKSQIKDLKIVSGIHEKLLPCYLSQNKVELKKKMVILEGGFISSGLLLMQNLLEQDADPVDFRIVRTEPKNVILTVTTDSDLNLSMADTLQFKSTVVDSIQPALKNFFQI
jgi:hypothetical protein